ncbi:MAG: flagellin [Candidatus Sumerlaeota bacterium]|nr:flagellin [Candidatus Sumerlaeota bacterium]
MALTVNTNIASLTAQRNLSRTTESLNKSLERLSSGLRINRAGDDAAGLAISEGLRAQVRGLNQAVRNANDGLSIVATAEGAMDEGTSIIQRMRELAVQAVSDTNSASNRASIQAEIDQSLSELNRIAGTVQFNGLSLLDGTFSGKNVQVGANAGQTISLSISDMRASSLGKVATLTGSEVLASLGAGELTLNGVSVGASAADGISYARANSSAISVANAINAVSGDTNVTAVANATSVTAASGSYTTTAVNGIADATSLKIDDVAIAASVAGDDTVSTHGNANSAIAVAAAINASTGDTNVVAVAGPAVKTNSIAVTAITLNTANHLVINGVTIGSDASPVTVLNGDSDSALAGAINTAMSGASKNITASVSDGMLTLTSSDGSNITVTTTGTAGVKLGFAASGNLTNDDTMGTVTLYSNNNEAFTVAAGASGIPTGFTAGAYQSVTAVDIDGTTNSLSINGVNIGAVSVQANDASGSLVKAINDRMNQTGVLASLNGSNQLVLNASDGRNITVTTTGTIGGALGYTNSTSTNVTDDTTAGTVTLYSDATFSILGTNPADAGLTAQSVMLDDTTALSSIDVTSSTGATAAIRTLDFSLTQVSKNRSDLGAITNRLESTIRNLQNVSENLTASDSRIRDVDFAAETAQMMRAQILQQAGLAILAQANTSTQAALSLLGR